MKKGYSLVELLVSLSIIAIILAIATININLVYRRLSRESQITNVVEQVYYLLSEARKRGFIDDNIVFIKYQNRKFEAFIDKNGDGVQDTGTTFYISVTVPSNIAVRINNYAVSSLSDFYTLDGIFAKKTGNSSGIPIFNFSNSNMTIDFTIDEVAKRIQIINSYPKIVESF